MKVYLVYWYNGSDTQVYGIFSTKEKVDAYIERLLLEYNDGKDSEYYCIKEVLVDEPMV